MYTAQEKALPRATTLRSRIPVSSTFTKHASLSNPASTVPTRKLKVEQNKEKPDRNKVNQNVKHKINNEKQISSKNKMLKKTSVILPVTKRIVNPPKTILTGANERIGNSKNNIQKSLHTNHVDKEKPVSQCKSATSCKKLFHKLNHTEDSKPAEKENARPTPQCKSSTSCKKQPHKLKYEVKEESKSAEKKNNPSPEKEIKTRAEINFQPNEFYRKFILSGKELNPSILKMQPGTKLSSVVAERPSAYKKFIVYSNPFQDAMKAIENADFSAKRARVSEVKQNLGLSSPFRVCHSTCKKFPIARNPYEVAMRSIEALRTKQKVKSSKKVTFNLKIEEVPPQHSFKGNESTSDADCKSRLANVSKPSEQEGQNIFHEDVNSNVSSVTEKIHKCSLQISEGADVMQERISNVSSRDPCPVVNERNESEVDPKCVNPASATEAQYKCDVPVTSSKLTVCCDLERKNLNDRTGSEIGDSCLTPITKSNPVMCFDKMESDCKPSFTDSSVPKTSISDSIATPSELVVGYDLERENLNGAIGMGDICITPVTKSNPVMCFDKIGSDCKRLAFPDSSVPKTSISHSSAKFDRNKFENRLSFTPKSSKCFISPSIKNNQPSPFNFNFISSIPKYENSFTGGTHVKLYTPLPVSYYSQSTVNSGSPEFLCDGASKQVPIHCAPICTPFVLRNMAKSYEIMDQDLSPVRIKLDFTNAEKDLENKEPEACVRRYSLASATLRNITTTQKVLDHLADQECCLLSNRGFPVICGRHLRNPISLTLSEGDEMHFVPVEFQ